MKTEKNRKLRGSVLLTVVFVMSILIVFLFGTMALALAANNRAHVNYSSAQTGITARSVAESAVKAISDPTPSGKAYANAIGKLSAGQRATVGVQLGNDTENLASLGHVDDVVITYAGTKKFYDEVKQEWLDRDLLKFTSTVTMAGVTTTSSVYVLKHDKEDAGAEGSGGAGFVTTAGANLATQSSIVGGAYIQLPPMEMLVDEHGNKKINYTTHETFMNTFLNPTDPTKSFICDFNEDDATHTALHGANSGSFIQADLYVCHNFFVKNLAALVFSDKGKGITVWGDMIFPDESSKTKMVYNGTEYSQYNFNEIPYIYVDGTIRRSPDGNGYINLSAPKTSGGADVPMNVFCGSIDANAPNTLVIGGNIYCMEADKTSYIKAKNPTVLYAWTGDVVNRFEDENAESKICGDICSKGNLEVEKVHIRGDLRVEGNCVIGNNVTVDGDIVVGGTLTVTGDKPSIGEDKNLYINNYAPGTAEKFTKVEDKSVEFDNIKGYYQPYFINEHVELDGDGNIERYLLANGDEFDISPYYDSYNEKFQKYYVWNQEENRNDEFEYTYEDFGTLYYVKKDDGTFDPDSVPTIKLDTVFAGEPDENYFYYETKVVDAKFDEKGDYIPGSAKLEIADENSRLTTPTFTFHYSKSSNENKTYSEYGEHAYPEYAEKDVILGDDKSTKVVKKIEEVLKEIANPFDNSIDLDTSKIPKKLAELVNGLKDESYVTSLDDPRIKYDTTDNNHHQIIIEKSCKLDLSVGTENGKTIYIKPGTQEIVILVKNLSVGNGVPVIIDDSQGGTVNMIIEKNGKFDHAGSAQIITKSYKDMFESYSGQPLKYMSKTSPGTDIATILKSNIKPKFNIYGEKDSEFHCSNINCITANVLSPDLTFKIEGGTGNTLNGDFYYNDINITNPGISDVTPAKNLVFGCLNTKDTVLPNQMFSIFTTDGGHHDGGGDAEEDNFWYKILYYNEY